MPLLRRAGSMVFSTSSRGVISTPQASDVFSSIGFFFAFMIFGKLA